MNLTPFNKSGKSNSQRIKLGAMIALMVLGLLLWSRLLLKQVPRTAIADDAPPAAAASPDKNADANAPRKAESHAPIPLDLPTRLTRDPFELDDSGYQKVIKPAPVVTQTVEPVRQAKSVDESADELRRIEAIRDAASQLTLQSTVTGANPRAVLNGVAVAPGQKFRGFTLLKVEARQVVLEREGVRVVLEM